MNQGPSPVSVMAPAFESAFDADVAFERTLGWITKDEQALLATKRVAIGGLGGVGGSHAVTLARLGIGHFHLADFDVFELANFNRQAGASMRTLGQPKLDVLANMVRDINPTAVVARFPKVDPASVGAFLEGVDLYVDGLDFFAFEARRLVFAECARRGIVAITAAPLGMGAALLVFVPGKMTFAEYFQLEGQSEAEQARRFLLGLSPSLAHRTYLVDPSRLDLEAHRGPSTPMACELCAGISGTEALKILLGRGEVKAAPHALLFDAYRQKLVHTYRPGGNRHPLHRVILAAARRRDTTPPPDAHVSRSGDPMLRILDAARWAPSGDNAQEWRFQVVSPEHLVVHGSDTRASCVFDVDGRPSQMALGALLENIRIGASAEGLRCDVQAHPASTDREPRFDVRFVRQAMLAPDPLAAFMSKRAVQRRAMSPRALSGEERRILEASLPEGVRVRWLEGKDKLRMAALMSESSKLRLSSRAAYDVHSSAIAWRSTFSNDKIPDASVGLDPLTLRLMRWTLGSFERMTRVNAIVGTFLPRLELDLVPGLLCAAHVALVLDAPPASTADFVRAGAAMQRFWLTAASLGLQLQPELMPLLCSWLSRDGRAFSTTVKAPEASEARTMRSIAERLERVAGPVEGIVFMARLGAGPRARARSTRKSIEELGQRSRR